MSKARITINETKSGYFELWMNPKGRELLVKKLMQLDVSDDHFHIGQREDLEVSSIPYRPDDKIIEWGKVYLRYDDWDEKHFPHVMKWKKWDPSELK